MGAETSEMGNYVVLKCFEWYMTLTNFRQGSFFVKAGDPIGVGQVIGLVGNSAAPAIPHLHMHVTRDVPDASGPAVPILFELRFSGRQRGVHSINQTAPPGHPGDCVSIFL